VGASVLAGAVGVGVVGGAPVVGVGSSLAPDAAPARSTRAPGSEAIDMSAKSATSANALTTTDAARARVLARVDPMSPGMSATRYRAGGVSSGLTPAPTPSN